MTTPVLPGLTDEVFVPVYVNLLDKIVSFTGVYKRPTDKKARKELQTDLSEVSKKIFRNTMEREEKWGKVAKDEKATLGDKEKRWAEIQKIADKKTTELNKFTGEITRKWLIRFEDLKSEADEEIPCDKKMMDLMFASHEYARGLNTGLDDVAHNRKRTEYDSGN